MYRNLASQVLGIGAPYIVSLIAVKVLALTLIYLAPGGTESLGDISVFAATLATSADIAVRIAASRNCGFSFSRHGADALLAVLFALQGMLCTAEVGPQKARGCRALRLVLPFVVLVSVGGNMMRLNRTKREPDAEGGRADASEKAELGMVVGNDPAVE
eukprot:TRINITY_DN80382_c0_g1_i1.p1 TRINITY_DN80382_c0_g1~~TRINITY_DN80382_c0_g1_i1.p1  ORF type:complete len:169 (-),score=32.76 TRINITY_DN80382_c0_g1_i1:66-542(-)